MANRIDKHYNDFGGLDTRSNKLISNPKTFRIGSNNVRYNFLDEIQKANGFQHKTDGIHAGMNGLAEYKYKDINTGESKTQILGLGGEGNLYKKVSHRLKLVKSSGAAVSYSFYYDATLDEYVFDVNPSLGQILILPASTLDNLVSAINFALAIPGLTAAVVDENGTVISSSLPAYLMDVTINKEFDIGVPVYNDSWFWEKVYFGDVAGVPFITTLQYLSTPLLYPDYQGLSSINSNNSIYLSDGGFPMKYDGYSVYRAGMPEVKKISSGVGLTPAVYGGISNTGLMTVNSTYRYLFQLGYVDANGFEVLGKVNLTEYLERSVSGAQNCMNIFLPMIQAAGTRDFPVYSCQVNGNLNFTNGAAPYFQVINVFAGHNIVVGMTLRVPILNSTVGGTGVSFMQCPVMVVAATAITVEVPLTGGMEYPYEFGAYTVKENQILQAGYVEDYQDTKITDIGTTVASYDSINPPVKFGAFIRVYRTKANGTQFYRHYDLALWNNNRYTFTDTVNDSYLTISLDDNSGEALPRACKYLSLWQNQLVQAGRPVDTNVKNLVYPTCASPEPVNAWGLNSTDIRDFFYTEAFLCDFQSIYWADPLFPEGFPQSGLFEDSLDTPFNDQIMGIAPNKDAFFAFKQRSMGYFTGNLAEQQINKEVIEADIGCASHNSIQEVRGSLIWLDAKNGFYSCVAGRLPQPIGYPIQDLIKLNTYNLDFSKAVAANLRIENLYFCAVENIMFVFDYAETEKGQRLCWYPWNNRLTPSALLASANDELLASSGQIWKMKRTNTKYDFTDHKSAIPFNLKTAWINFGMPTVDKQFLGCWINSIQGDFALTIEEYANYLDYLVSDIDVIFPIESATKHTVKMNAKNNIAKVSAISIGMTNSEKNTFVRIQGWDIQFAADFDSGEPKK